MDSLSSEEENRKFSEEKLEEFKENYEKSSKKNIMKEYQRYLKYKESVSTKTYSWPLEYFGMTKAYIKSLSFSPCGSYLSAAEDTKIKVWNMSEKSLEKTLTGHYDPICCLMYSPDGKLLASGSQDSTVKLWNMQEFKVDLTLSNNPGSITCLAFTESGAFLASGSSNNSINIWSLKEKALKATLFGHINQIVGLSSSPVGNFLASVSEDCVKIWDLELKKESFSTTESCGEVSAVAYSPDGRFLAFGKRSGITILNIQERHQEHSFTSTLEVKCLQYSNDGSLLFAGSKYQRIYAINTKEKSLAFTLEGYNKQVSCLSLSSSGKLLASGSKDKSIKIWDLVNIRENFALDGEAEQVRILVYSHNGKIIAAGSGGQKIVFWDLEEKREKFCNHSSNVYCFTFSHDGKTLAVGSEEESLTIWSLDNSFNETRIQGYTSGIFSLAYSNTGKLLAAGTGAGKVRVWDFSTNTESLIIDDLDSSVTFLSFSSNNKFLAAGTQEQVINLWNLEENREEFSLPTHYSWMTSLFFTPDSSFLVLCVKKSIKVWNLLENKKEFSLRVDSTRESPFSMSSNGKFLAGCSYKKMITVWDFPARKELFCFSTSFKVLSLAFSPNECFLAAGTTSEKIKIWNLNQRREEYSIDLFSFKFSRINCSDLSSDGNFLAAASRSEHFKVWNLRENHEEKVLKSEEVKEESEIECERTPWDREADAIHHLAFSPDAKLLAADAGDKGINIWNVRKNQVEFTLRKNDRVKRLLYSPNAKMLAFATHDFCVKVWDLEQKEEIITFNCQDLRVFGFTFSPDSKFLAASSNGKDLKVWNLVEKNEEKMEFTDCCGAYCLKYSPNGKFLAASVVDKGIVIWDLGRKNEELLVPCCFSSPEIITFSPDGKFLASGDSKGLIMVWNIEKKEEEFSVKYHFDHIPIRNLIFTLDQNFLFSWDNCQCQKINVTDKLAYILNENVKNCIKQRNDLKNLYRDAEVALNIYKFNQEYIESKNSLENELNKLISQSIIDWQYSKNDKIIEKISKYILKFSQIGINPKYLTHTAVNCLRNISNSNNLTKVINCDFNTFIIDLGINLVKDEPIRKKLIKYKEALKILGSCFEVNLESNPTHDLKKSIYYQELSHLKFINSSEHDDFKVHYLTGKFYSHQVLIKKYIISEYISKSQKSLIILALEKEAYYLDKFSKISQDSKCFCDFLGIIKDENSYSFVMRNEGINLKQFMKKFKKSGCRKPSFDIQNSLYMFIEMIKIMQQENVELRRINIESFLITKDSSLLIFDLVDCFYKTSEHEVFKPLSLLNHFESLEQNDLFNECLEKQNVRTVGIIILQLALKRKIDIFREKLDYFWPKLRKNGFAALSKILKNMCEDQMTYRDLINSIEF